MSSNRAENNDNGLTSIDVALSVRAADGLDWFLAWLPMRLVGVLEVGFRGGEGVGAPVRNA